jgi:hypothetical protein
MAVPVELEVQVRRGGVTGRRQRDVYRRQLRQAPGAEGLIQVPLLNRQRRTVLYARKAQHQIYV